jgi:uncharacterized membrane protein YdjX (TVP38/TMEM64 family)
MIETALSLANSFTDMGPAGLLLLAALFFFGAVVFLPRPAACLFGGATVGFWAIPIGLVSTTAGAVAALLLARTFFRERLITMAASQPRWRAVIEAVEAEGWRLVALLRVASPVPGSLLSYLFGLTRIGVGPFAAATFAGCIPQVVTFVALGVAARTMLDKEPVSHAVLIFGVVGLIMVASAVTLVVRRMRRARAV